MFKIKVKKKGFLRVYEVVRIERFCSKLEFLNGLDFKDINWDFFLLIDI